MATQTVDCGGGLTATWDDAVSGPLTITYDGTGTGVMKNYLMSVGKTPPWYSSRTILTSLSLPDGITCIGNYAFYSCSALTGSLTIPSSITSIGNYAFHNCSGFTGSLTIPKSVQTIGWDAFCHCSGLTGSLTIPDGITTIETNAFTGCSGFNGLLTIPNSVTTIGSAFYNCPGFTDIKFLGDKPSLVLSAFKLNDSSPEKTYNVYSNGWANSTTFPEYDYTKWNYITDPSLGTNTYVWDGSSWRKGTPYVWDGSSWRKASGKTSVYDGSSWRS